MSYSQKSFYKNTRQINNIRDYWGEIYLPHDETTDQDFEITLEYQNKPGLLAYRLYGSARYSWIFAFYNRDTIHDATVDLTVGKVIKVPAPTRIKNI